MATTDRDAIIEKIEAAISEELASQKYFFVFAVTEVGEDAGGGSSYIRGFGSEQDAHDTALLILGHIEECLSGKIPINDEEGADPC
jgi:hypothetical protein